MNIFQRMSAGGVAAIGITFGLGLMMAGMIAVEFTPLNKQEAAEFEINPVAEDIVPIISVSKPEMMKKVETPPPPPIIDRETANLPDVQIIDIDGDKPVFTPPKLDPKAYIITISNRDAQPLVRIAGQMPPGAERSGHCKMRFDVSPVGVPYNVETVYCTDRIFERNSVKATSKFKYNPKILDERAVAMNGVETTIRYKLTDGHGRVIPE